MKPGFLFAMALIPALFSSHTQRSDPVLTGLDNLLENRPSLLSGKRLASSPITPALTGKESPSGKGSRPWLYSLPSTVCLERCQTGKP